jgi:hypothetical protein
MPTLSSHNRDSSPLGRVRARFGWVIGSALCLVFIPLSSQADPEKEARYPFDPACPWGRIANGKGMIHRCLSEDEARRLVSGQPAAEPSAKADGAAKPTAAEAGTSPNTGAPEKATDEVKKPREYTISVGPIVASQGDITIGKLGAPLDRYRACVDENGGLETTRGKVVVSFLVQAARSRAEGVEISKVSGISKKAAQCIADVIDRRRVGTPSEETTGAELTIELVGK